jgi:hypothetical protein
MPETVAEQVAYEVGDPAAYLLPDVTCDLSEVVLTQDGPDRVRVTGARGRPAPPTLKASITYADGFKAVGTLMIGGPDATLKARRTAEAILARTGRLLAEHGMEPVSRASIEVLGAEDTYGPHARRAESREVVLKLAIAHSRKDGAELFSREFLACATGMAQGITGFAGGRPKVSPVIRLLSCLVGRDAVAPRLVFEGRESPAPPVCPGEPSADPDACRTRRGETLTSSPSRAAGRGASPLDGVRAERRQGR